ncbi:MAG: dihydrodipicolinate reductase [Roseivirga sp.]|nr:dihydrodipicolinate reductase [Roseivirga sp.]
MKKIKIVQVGMGPLGIKIGQFISERKSLETVGAVDKNPVLIGKPLSALHSDLSQSVTIKESLSEVLAGVKPDVAVLTTVSDMERITPQVEEIVRAGIPVVSTCEELSYPWDCAPELSERINKLAAEMNTAVVGTGVNPGFLMDSLPAFLTSVCQHVEKVSVSRYQNAAFRRVPFQRKIGAGLSLEAFEQKKQEGTLRHVGLTESMQFIAAKMGWKLDATEDVISPVIASEDIHTESMDIKKGDAMGVCQVGKGWINGEEKITLTFQAAVGEPASYDEVNIEGNPDISSRIEGGVNGDVATCAITINAIAQVLEARPGLRTMGDLPLTSYFD